MFAKTSALLIVGIALAAPSDEFASARDTWPTVDFSSALNAELLQLEPGQTLESEGRIYTRLAAPAFASYAEVIQINDVHTEGANHQVSNLPNGSIESFSIPVFDTSLGSLTKVGIATKGKMDRVYQIENFNTTTTGTVCWAGGSCADSRLVGEMTILPSNWPGSCSFPTSVGYNNFDLNNSMKMSFRQYDGTFDFGGSSGDVEISNDELSSSDVDEFTDACILTEFETDDGFGYVNAGPFDFLGTIDSGAAITTGVMQSDLDYYLDIEIEQITVTVTYTY